MSDAGRTLFERAWLDRVLEPVEKATGLPGALYLEPAVFSLEQEALFAASWVCVARSEDLAQAGSWLRAEVAGRSLLLVAGDDGQPRAFHNACRHRGACLVQQQSGRAQAFRCGYHGWSYGRDGRLLAAPLMDERADFDPAQHGLAPVRLEAWEGFLFVNLDEDAQPLADATCDFPELGGYGLTGLRRAAARSYEVGANWKILCENYSECYHCALVHPQLNRITDYRSGGQGFFGRNHDGGPMRLRPGFATVSTSGRAQAPGLADLADDDRRQVQYLHFYPTFLLGLAPDYAVVHRVLPVDPGRSRVVCELYFPPAAQAREGFDAGDAVEFWDLTNRQDWEQCERVQAGAAARTTPGPYHPLEACVHAFDRWLVERLGEGLAALRR